MTHTPATSPHHRSPWLRPELIAQLAHSRWIVRQTPSELNDWLEAESELRVVGHLSQQLITCKQRLLRMSNQCQRMKSVLAAQHAVGSVLAGSRNLATAARPILAAIARCLGWTEGKLWLIDRPDGVLRLKAVWRASAPARPEGPTCEVTPSPDDLAGRVWASGLPLANPATSDSRAGPGSAQAAALESGTAVAVPIRNDVFYGIMEFSSAERQSVDDQLLEMLADLGYQIGQFIQRDEVEGQLREQDADRRIAGAIQEGLLPQAMPRLPGFAIAGRCSPAQVVGGDCFDFMSLGSDGAERLGVMIADASGHGVAAALMVAETRAYLRALALQSADVGALLTLTNRRLTPKVPGGGAFVTAFLARLDVGTRTLTYASAGHCPAHVLDADGQTRELLQSTGWPLAIDASTIFDSPPPLRLDPGDIVFIYSDGLTDAMSGAGEMFGLGRAIAYVREHRSEDVEAILSGLFGRVRLFQEGHPQSDDITAVLIKVDSRAGPLASEGC